MRMLNMISVMSWAMNYSELHAIYNIATVIKFSYIYIINI